MSKVGMVAWIRDKGNPGALDPAWDRVCHLPRARAPVGRDAAWFHGIRYGSDPGALVPTWSNVCHIPRARAPVGGGCDVVAWIWAGVIRAPMLLIDSAARLIEIRDSSNCRALNPAWDSGCRFQLARPPEYNTERS